MSPRKATKLLTEHAPDVYAELDIERNSELFPEIDFINIGCGSKELIWWNCKAHGHSWRNTVSRRYYRGHGCPICSGRETLPGWNDLLTTHPEIFKELHTIKNTEAGIVHKYLSPATPTRVWWKCKVDAEHVWQARVSQRTTGVKSGCPKCHTFKSESEFRKLFNDATNLTFESGHIIAERELFKRNKVQIDIVNHEHKIAIEYDGHFSHGGNTLYKTTKEECFAKDTDSTQAILNAGYTIIRIRENPLANLALKHPDLKQLKYKDKSDKSGTL